MKKPAFCICENKDADQLRGNREADQRLCFRYSDSKIPILLYIRTFKPLAIFCGCTARFVSDLVGNSEERFSHNEAQIYKYIHKMRTVPKLTKTQQKAPQQNYCLGTVSNQLIPKHKTFDQITILPL